MSERHANGSRNTVTSGGSFTRPGSAQRKRPRIVDGGDNLRQSVSGR